MVSLLYYILGRGRQSNHTEYLYIPLSSYWRSCNRLMKFITYLQKWDYLKWEISFRQNRYFDYFILISISYCSYIVLQLPWMTLYYNTRTVIQLSSFCFNLQPFLVTITLFTYPFSPWKHLSTLLPYNISKQFLF